MHRYIALFLLFFASSGYPQYLYADGFEDMADTGWLSPDLVAYARGPYGPELLDEGDFSDLNDEQFDSVGSPLGSGITALIPPIVGGDTGPFPLHRARLAFQFPGVSIPGTAVVTGISVRAAVAATARDMLGTIVLVPASDMQFVDTELYFAGDGSFTSGNIAANGLFPYGVEPGEIDDGTDFLVREWGGEFDGFGTPAIPSDPAEYSAPFFMALNLTNNGPYQLQGHFDLFQIKIHYQSFAIIGTGTISATTLRGIPITAAMTGTGTVALATDGASATRQISANMVGTGAITSSVRKDVGGVITVYGFSDLVGSGVVDAAVTRNIPIAAALTGTGTVVAQTLRGISVAGPNRFDPDTSLMVLFGQGTITAIANRIQRITAALVGSGTIDALTNKIQLIAAALTGTGTITAETFAHRQVAAALVGTGTITATTNRARGQAVALVGEGVITAATLRGIRIAAALVGTGTIEAEPSAGTNAPAPDDRTFRVPERDSLFRVPEEVYLFVAGTNSMGAIGRVFKQPAEIKDFDITFEDFFGGILDGDALLTVTAVVATGNTGAAGDLVLGPGLLNPTVIIATDRVKVWLGAGVSGITYKVTATATTAGGRVEEEDVYVQVREV